MQNNHNPKTNKVMKEKADYNPLLATAVLITAGMVSPSNGIDDRTYKTPSEFISTILIIGFISICVYSLLIGISSKTILNE